MRRLVLMSLAGAVVLLCCAKQLGDLLPFPCPADGKCPEPSVCSVGGQCVLPEAYGTCRSSVKGDYAFSGPASADYVCINDVIYKECFGADDCAATETCVLAFGGYGGCQLRCDQGATCPSGTQCLGGLCVGPDGGSGGGAGGGGGSSGAGGGASAGGGTGARAIACVQQREVGFLEVRDLAFTGQTLAIGGAVFGAVTVSGQMVNSPSTSVGNAFVVHLPLGGGDAVAARVVSGGSNASMVTSLVGNGFGGVHAGGWTKNGLDPGDTVQGFLLEDDIGSGGTLHLLGGPDPSSSTPADFNCGSDPNTCDAVRSVTTTQSGRAVVAGQYASSLSVDGAPPILGQAGRTTGFVLAFDQGVSVVGVLAGDAGNRFDAVSSPPSSDHREVVAVGAFAGQAKVVRSGGLQLAAPQGGLAVVRYNLSDGGPTYAVPLVAAGPHGAPQVHPHGVAFGGGTRPIVVGAALQDAVTSTIPLTSTQAESTVLFSLGKDAGTAVTLTHPFARPPSFDENGPSGVILCGTFDSEVTIGGQLLTTSPGTLAGYTAMLSSDLAAPVASRVGEGATKGSQVELIRIVLANGWPYALARLTTAAGAVPRLGDCAPGPSTGSVAYAVVRLDPGSGNVISP